MSTTSRCLSSSTSPEACASVLAIDNIVAITVDALNAGFEGTYGDKDAMVTQATNLKVRREGDQRDVGRVARFG